MRHRQRDREETRPEAVGTPDAGHGDEAQAVQAEAARFLDAADAALDRALGRDEREDLSNVRQMGGQ